MYKKYSSIRVRPVIFARDTNGDYILDENGKKIVEIESSQINPSNSYDVLTEIQEENY